MDKLLVHHRADIQLTFTPVSNLESPFNPGSLGSQSTQSEPTRKRHRDNMQTRGTDPSCCEATLLSIAPYIVRFSFDKKGERKKSCYFSKKG